VARYPKCTDTTKEKTIVGKATTTNKGKGKGKSSMSDEELKGASCTGGLRYLQTLHEALQGASLLRADQEARE